MEKHQKDTEPSAAEHTLVGAGVGAAGAGSTIAIIGLSAALPLLPVFVVIGAAGGLAWWGAKTAAKKL
jgi:hypothetical protein